MINNISTSSSPKIIVLCDKDITIDYSHYFFNLDTITLNTITCHTANDVITYITSYKLYIDVIAIHTDNTETLNKYINELSILPEYYKKKIVMFNDYNEHCEEIYNIITRQLSNAVSPMFSFITPLHNTNLKYFKQAYSSLKQQAINDWEWILLDDSQEPLDEIKRIADNDCRLFYYRLTPVSYGNIGLTKHNAFMLSHGNWLIELDHDDYVIVDFLIELTKAINTHKDAGFIFSPTVTIDDKNKYKNIFDSGEFAYGYGICDERYGIKYHYNDINELTLLHIIGVPNHVRCWNRDVYFSICGHNQYIRACDDYELILKTFLKTKFTRINAPIYVQRYHANNSQNENDNLLDINIRVEYIVKYYFNSIFEVLKNRYNIDIHKFDNHNDARTYYLEHPHETHTLNYVV